MRCVLDSNIGVKWLLQEDQSDKARIIRDELSAVRTSSSPQIFSRWNAPDALTRAQRQERVTPDCNGVDILVSQEPHGVVARRMSSTATTSIAYWMHARISSVSRSG